MVDPVVAGSLVSGGLGLAGGKSGKGRQKIARRVLRNAGVKSRRDIKNLAKLDNRNIPLLEKLMRAAPNEFNFQLEDDPGFNFIRDEALEAATRKLNAGGFQDSGNILAELQNRASGLAASNVNDQFARQLGAFTTNEGLRQQRIGNLSNLVNLGAQASQNSANIRNQVASNLANAYIGAAQQAQQGQQFALNSVNNAIQGGIANSMLADLINRRPQSELPLDMSILR